MPQVPVEAPPEIPEEVPETPVASEPKPKKAKTAPEEEPVPKKRAAPTSRVSGVDLKAKTKCLICFAGPMSNHA